MKINLKKYLIVLLGALVLSSCSTDKTMIAKGVDLNKYGYASIVKGQTIHGTETDIEIEPGIYDALESTRLKMIGEHRLNVSGKTVASCRSSNRFALTRQKDVNRAINKLAKRIHSIWK